MGRAVVIVGFLLFGLPILISLALFGLGLGAQIWVASAILAAVGLIDDVPKKAEWDVVNVRKHESLTESYRTIVEPQKLMDARSINLVTVLGLGDMPKHAPINNPSDAENTMKLLAPQFATEECARIKQAFADQCVVEDTRIRPLSSGQFTASFKLTFTMKEAFGNVPEKTPLAIVEIDQSLVEGGANGRLVPRATQTEARLAAYRRAATLCQSVRTSRGNCALRTISIRMMPEGTGLSSVRMTGQAKLVFLQRQ
jgi:hypothetical protein